MKKYKYIMRYNKKGIMKLAVITGAFAFMLLCVLKMQKANMGKVCEGIFGRVSTVSAFIKSDRQDMEVGLFSIYPAANHIKGNSATVEAHKPKFEDNYADYVKMYEVIEESASTAVEEKEEESKAQYISASTITGQVYDYNDLINLDFLKKNFYTITSITSLNEENFNPKNALDMDLSMEKKSDEPQILILHSHSQEMFADSVEGDYDTYIVGVGKYLAKILTEQYGYNVIHDTTQYDILDGKLDRSKAYTYSNQGIEKILKENPSIKVVLDVHRDGVGEDIHLVTEVNGKPTAQVMFFNGISYTKVNGAIDYLYNPYLAENLAMSLQMHLITKAYYPGYARRNYIQGYRYSQHHAGRSMLIEVGAQNNTLEEAMNAMEPLADTLDKLLTGTKVY